MIKDKIVEGRRRRFSYAAPQRIYIGVVKHADGFDAAGYILSRQGAITGARLEKLCFYAQAWGLQWDGKPLFGEPFEAWPVGPTCPVLYARHEGRFTVHPGEIGNGRTLDAHNRETVDTVLAYYGILDAYELASVAYRDVRGMGIPDGKRIPVAVMMGYFAGFTN